MDKKENNEGSGIQISLSLKSDTAYQVRDMHRELMKKEISQLPPINKGEIDINGNYIVSTGEKIEVGFYMRNGHAHAIRLGNVPITITDKENNLLAKQEFNLNILGTIPPYSARPGEIYFNRDNLYVDKISQENWKINFKEEPEPEKFVAIKYLNLPKNISQGQLAKLKYFIEKLPPLKPNTVTFSALQAAFKDEDGSLMATVVIRNGSNHKVSFNNLQVLIKDAKKREVASHSFNLSNIEFNSLSARLWTFTFPKESILVKDMDLSHWTISIKKQ